MRILYQSILWQRKIEIIKIMKFLFTATVSFDDEI